MLPADLDLFLVLVLVVGGCAAGWVHSRVVIRRLKREAREDDRLRERLRRDDPQP